MRSSQNGAVSAAATAELSSFWRRLSISTIDGICRSLAVTRLRHSSSSRPSVITDAPAPVRIVAIASTISVAPVPGVGFSIRCSGVGPSIIERKKPSSSSATACAFSDGDTNGKSPSRSSQMSARAAAISSADGRSAIAGTSKPGRRGIEQPGIRMIAGRGQQPAVAAKHWRVDDADQHRQAGIGRCQHRLDQQRRRMGRNEFALALMRRQLPSLASMWRSRSSVSAVATGRPSSSGTTQVGTPA